MRATKIGIALLAAPVAFFLLGRIDAATYLTEESRAVAYRFESQIRMQKTFAVEDLVTESPVFYCICGQRSGGCKVEASALARKIGYIMPSHNFSRPFLFGIDGLKLFYRDRVVAVDAGAAVADEGWGFCGTDLRHRHRLQGDPEYFDLNSYNGDFAQ